MRELGLSPTAAARGAEIDSGQYSRFLSGRAGLGAAKLKRLADVLGVDVDQLHVDVASRVSAEPRGNVVGRLEDLRPPDAVRLPIYRWGSCGDPRDTHSAPDADHEEYPPAGRESLIGPRGFGVLVKGESMSRRGIHDGDIVWVNPDRGTRVGGVVLADCRSRDGADHGMVVKVLREESQSPMRGTVQVLQADGEQDRYDVDCDEFAVIGPVVLVMSIRPPG